MVHYNDNIVINVVSRVARVRVDSNYIDKVVWDDSLPLSYLVPTLTGPGVCTVALVDVLVLAHNEFVEKCHGNQ